MKKNVEPIDAYNKIRKFNKEESDRRDRMDKKRTSEIKKKRRIKNGY